MKRRSLGRAGALALIASLACTGLASADAGITDGDAAAGTQSNIHIGTVLPGAVVSVPVAFVLRCTTTNHVDVGQTVTFSLLQAQAAPGGAVLSVTPGTVGPIPAGWPADGATCPDPQPILESTTSAVVTLRAPTIPTVGYTYTVGFARSYSPTGNVDGSAVSNTPSIVIRLDVADNTPPILTVPDDLTVEGDTTGGATAAFAVSATDAQDDPDPTPTCDVDPGDLLPLGATTVSCSVTDGGGLTVSDSFVITVVDTTAPNVADPADVQTTTGDPAGAAVSFATPAASDVVDAAPTVDCAPVSGSTFPVGTTTVTCAATDASGNAAATTFDVTVAYVAPHTASATWLAPVSGGTFVANRGRTVPIKVQMSVDGVARTSGDAHLTITPCGGGTALTMPLSYGGGRWNAAVDTGPLAGACHVVTAWIDGLEAGTFELDVRGAETTKQPAKDRVKDQAAKEQAAKDKAAKQGAAKERDAIRLARWEARHQRRGHHHAPAPSQG